MGEIVTDFLGHPCRVTEAYGYFGGHAVERRAEVQKEPRLLAREIGAKLLVMRDRLEHSMNASNAVLAALSDDSDADAARAVLAMASAYGSDTVERFHELAALVLLALEHAGLAKEPSHG